jgi:hypothetical protein
MRPAPGSARVCQHCGQQVEDYDEHFLACAGIRAAFDDTYNPGHPGHYQLSAAEKAARRNERVRNWRAARGRGPSLLSTAKMRRAAQP